MPDNEPLSVVELEGSLADVEEPKELPDGTYNGEITGVTAVDRQTGNSGWNLTVTIPTSEYPKDFDVDNAPDGFTLYYNMLNRPKKGDQRAAWRLKTFLEAIDEPTNTTTLDPNDWMGKACTVQVKLGKPYQGNPARAEIRAFIKGEPKVAATAARGRRR